MPDPRIKGRVIVDSIQLGRVKLGEEFVAKAIAQLDEPLRRLVEAGLSQSDWYPVDLWLQYTEVSAKLLGLDDAVFQKLSEEATYHQLRGTYRALLQTDPEAMVRRSIASVRTYWKNVSVTVISIEPGKALVRVAGFDERHRLVEPLFTGFSRRSLEMAGARNARAEFVVPIGDPSGHAELRLTWK